MIVWLMIVTACYDRWSVNKLMLNCSPACRTLMQYAMADLQGFTVDSDVMELTWHSEDYGAIACAYRITDAESMTELRRTLQSHLDERAHANEDEDEDHDGDEVEMDGDGVAAAADMVQQGEADHHTGAAEALSPVPVASAVSPTAAGTATSPVNATSPRMPSFVTVASASGARSTAVHRPAPQNVGAANKAVAAAATAGAAKTPGAVNAPATAQTSAIAASTSPVPAAAAAPSAVIEVPPPAAAVSNLTLALQRSKEQAAQAAMVMVPQGGAPAVTAAAAAASATAGKDAGGESLGIDLDIDSASYAQTMKAHASAAPDAVTAPVASAIASDGSAALLPIVRRMSHTSNLTMALAAQRQRAQQILSASPLNSSLGEPSPAAEAARISASPLHSDLGSPHGPVMDSPELDPAQAIAFEKAIGTLIPASALPPTLSLAQSLTGGSASNEHASVIVPTSAITVSSSTPKRISSTAVITSTPSSAGRAASSGSTLTAAPALSRSVSLPAGAAAGIAMSSAAGTTSPTPMSASSSTDSLNAAGKASQPGLSRSSSNNTPAGTVTAGSPPNAGAAAVPPKRNAVVIPSAASLQSGQPSKSPPSVSLLSQKIAQTRRTPLVSVGSVPALPSLSRAATHSGLPAAADAADTTGARNKPGVNIIQDYFPTNETGALVSPGTSPRQQSASKPTVTASDYPAPNLRLRTTAFEETDADRTPSKPVPAFAKATRSSASRDKSHKQGTGNIISPPSGPNSGPAASSPLKALVSKLAPKKKSGKAAGAAVTAKSFGSDKAIVLSKSKSTESTDSSQFEASRSRKNTPVAAAASTDSTSNAAAAPAVSATPSVDEFFAQLRTTLDAPNSTANAFAGNANTRFYARVDVILGPPSDGADAVKDVRRPGEAAVEKDVFMLITRTHLFCLEVKDTGAAGAAKPALSDSESKTEADWPLAMLHQRSLTSLRTVEIGFHLQFLR